ncbi:MAG: ABC transporter ATP-binding protein [bacterium]|nr:ABC transporter ATP-binding protein [bacterium]
MSIVSVKDIRKTFGEKDNAVEVLKGINLEIEKGDFVSLMGASGSGKSTLLYIVGGLDEPTSGEVLINGLNLNEMKDRPKSKMRRTDIGFIFQFYNLIPNLSVSENILLPAVMDGRKKSEFKDKLEEILEIVGLTEKRNRMPYELSGGQQQRVSIARAVIMEPSLILADEATGNLDSKSGMEIMNLFRRINEEKNITFLQVTHSSECAKLGKRVVVLKDGEIVSSNV